MVKITAEMKAVMKNTHVFMLATATKNGVPNVAPMGMVFLQDDDETIWIIDNYMNKTLKNIEENPLIALSVWNPEDKTAVYQFKGKAIVENKGADYEKAVSIAHSKSDKYPAKGLVKITLTEVFSSVPGPNAGDKLL